FARILEINGGAMKKLGLTLAIAVTGVAFCAGILSNAASAKTKHANAGQEANPAATTPKMPEANPQDVASVDAIIAALYDVISGPAGDRNWDRFRSLFIPEGRLTAIRVDKEGKISYAMMSADDYVNRAGPRFKERAFFETEASRKTEAF